MKNLIFAVIIMLIIFACSDKNPVKNDGDENIVVTDSSVTVTVTNPKEETVIEFKDNTITIPEGAVEEGTKITVSYLSNPLINWESKSEEIKIESTEIINDSITIKCPDPNVNISTMAIIKYGEKNYSVQKTKKQLGNAIFTFLPASNNSLKKSSGVKEWIVGAYSIPENLWQDKELIGEIDTNSDKKVLVLIHGLTADTEKWNIKTQTGKTFYQEMEENYNDRILMYQYPSGVSVDKNVSELYSLLDEKIFSKNSNIPIDIVGHSMGGVIGRKFTLLYSWKVTNLVTLGSPLNGALMDYKCVDMLFFTIDPVGIVISWILSMHTQGGQDLTFHSPFMEELNTIGGFTANRYLNIIGTDGYKIWSENDGLVLTISADMTHHDFPTTREYPCELISKKFFLSHSNIPFGESDLFNTIKEFLKETQNQPPSKPQLLTPEDGFILYESSITLSWTESIDPEGYEINYILYVIQPHEGEGSEMMGKSTSYFSDNVKWLGEYQWWVVAKDPEGNETKSDIWTFTKEDLEGVTDIDGNVYKTVKIGNQVWMAENLKVTRYRNGDVIPNVTGTEWENLTTGAWCSYNNDTKYVSIYGLFYNGYTVCDNRNVAPEGWHVPTDADWKELEIYLGMDQSEADSTGYRGKSESVGGKLKVEGLEYWHYPNRGATNQTEFSAFPGGWCSKFGTFGNIGYETDYWTSTPAEIQPSYFLYFRMLTYYHSSIYRLYYSKPHGCHIRCVKD